MCDFFRDRVLKGVKAFLFAENLDGEMRSLTEEIVYAKIMLDRWLFVGYSKERRERALSVHKRQVLKVFYNGTNCQVLRVSVFLV